MIIAAKGSARRAGNEGAKMNGYIINPAWFYWVNVVNHTKAIMFIFAAVLLLSAIGAYLVFMDALFAEERERYEKVIPKMAIAGIVCVIIAIFIPTKETLIEMQIAKYATWENTEWTVGVIKEAVDYIVNAIGSIK